MNGHDTHTLIISRNVWNPITKKFIKTEGERLELKHSLYSLRLWEMKWHKPLFKTLEERTITSEELIDYIQCMTINKNVNPYAYYAIDNDDMTKIMEYMDDPKTATVFADNGKKEKNSRFITAELIYTWMLMAHIPFECEKWHIGQLLTLIRTYGEENAPEEQKPMNQFIAEREKENERRRKLFNTTG